MVLVIFFLADIFCGSLKSQNLCSKISFFLFLVMKSHIFIALSSKNPKEELIITEGEDTHFTEEMEP